MTSSLEKTREFEKSLIFSNDVIIHTFQQPITERIKISRLLKKLSFQKTEYLKSAYF